MSITIPCIDISSDITGTSTLGELKAACEEWSFFQITGHGIDSNLRHDLFEEMQEFFRLSARTGPLETMQIKAKKSRFPGIEFQRFFEIVYADAEYGKEVGFKFRF
ncbi:MAG: hypothetical protein CMQ17_00755 [Gammaproteobacteria bacterium]|nr:hypothetical protein [Gammaproteobacteria bacterium]